MYYWDKTWVGNDYMNPEIISNQLYISTITLNLFTDSGWYPISIYL